MTVDLDLNDPAIRRMIRVGHTPDDIWTDGALTAVDCGRCRHPWPCLAVAAERAATAGLGPFGTADQGIR